MRITSAGHAAVAAALVAVGIFGLVRGDFAPIWEPVADDVLGRTALVYATALLSVVLGVGLVVGATAAVAARVWLVAIAVWLARFRAPVAVSHPTVASAWSGCAETAVFLAAATLLYARLAAATEPRRVRAVRVARAIYGLALIPFGIAHFAYLKETVALVPSWLPAPETWAYATGAAFLVAAAAVLTGIFARLAAALSAAQIGAFTALVWVPIVATSHDVQPYQWSETVLSAALTAAAWVVAESYRVKS